jgi:hypothetical protein
VECLSCLARVRATVHEVGVIGRGDDDAHWQVGSCRLIQVSPEQCVTEFVSRPARKPVLLDEHTGARAPEEVLPAADHERAGGGDRGHGPLRVGQPRPAPREGLDVSQLVRMRPANPS